VEDTDPSVANLMTYLAWWESVKLGFESIGLHSVIIAEPETGTFETYMSRGH
jgi:hypothetical protein